MPKLDALFDQVMTSTGIAGMAGAVWMGDKVWKRAGGYANLEQKTPYDPAANVRIASVTKSFVATAVLQLVDAGALKLDDVLEKFVPGIANGPTITMRDLLGMTSGIYDFTSNAAFNTKFDANPDMPWTFADTLAIIKANQPLFAPGTNIAYCDSNYSILGEIIQMVTGKPARTVIADSIAAKLSLTHTLWPADSTIPAPHPNGYVPQGLDPAKPNQAFDNTAHPPKVVNAVNPAVAGRSSRASTTSRSGAGRSPKGACWRPRHRQSGSRPGGSTGSRSTSATAWAASGSTTSPGTTVRSTGSARWSSVIRRTTSPSPSSATSRPTPRPPRRRSATSSSGSSTRPSGPEPERRRAGRHLGWGPGGAPMVGSSASATFGPSLVELTTRRLRDEILSGAVAPGERLIEEQICRRFSISQSPVRESLRLLAQQGLVEHLPRRGARVAVWSDEDVQQLFALRTVLERYAISAALPLTPTNGTDPLAEVRRHLDRMAAAEKDGDQLAEDDAHRDFHAAIVALAGNRQLDLMYEPVMLKLQRPMAVNLRAEAAALGPGEGIRRHRELITALETDDPAVVIEALEKHGSQRYLSPAPVWATGSTTGSATATST